MRNHDPPLCTTCSIANDREEACKFCTNPNPAYDTTAQIGVLTVSTVKNNFLYATLESDTGEASSP